MASISASAASKPTPSSRQQNNFPPKQYLSGPSGPLFLCKIRTIHASLTRVITITPRSAAKWSNSGMEIKRLEIFALALALVFSGTALASEIYKWTDADGNVHYVDRPSGQPTEQRVDITYKRTSGAAVQARVDARRESQAARRESSILKDKEEQTLAEQRAEQEQRQQKCENYRAKLETMVTSRRLYREDENGERVYLDDTQILEARQRAEELVAEYCGS